MTRLGDNYRLTPALSWEFGPPDPVEPPEQIGYDPACATCRSDEWCRLHPLPVERRPSLTPHCAGRAAVAHQRTRMVPTSNGWRCPACGEHE
jgi:hypothetical protein